MWKKIVADWSAAPGLGEGCAGYSPSKSAPIKINNAIRLIPPYSFSLTTHIRSQAPARPHTNPQTDRSSASLPARRHTLQYADLSTYPPTDRTYLLADPHARRQTHPPTDPSVRPPADPPIRSPGYPSADQHPISMLTNDLKIDGEFCHTPGEFCSRDSVWGENSLSRDRRTLSSPDANLDNLKVVKHTLLLSVA